MQQIHRWRPLVLASLLFGVGFSARGQDAAIVGSASDPDATGVVAEATSTFGFTFGLEASVESPDGISGMFLNDAGGQVISGAVGPEPFTEIFRVFGNGNVDAEGLVITRGAGLNSLNGGLHVGADFDADGNLTFGGTLTGVGSRTGQSSVNGHFSVGGTLSKAAGMFTIDHPLDPANKYLSHSFVESPDMKNVYDGVISLDENGQAWVRMPDWFEALNADFRYQLTAIGAPMPTLHIAEEISSGRFKIGGGLASGRVSWQVTGIRQDVYALAHRIRVEEEKPDLAKGSYLHPELYPDAEAVVASRPTP